MVLSCLRNAASEFSDKVYVTFRDVTDPCKLRLNVSWTYSFSGKLFVA